jgi:hypothetical protein
MLAALLRRFPDRELAIRRLHRSDSRFRSVCDDYEEAAAALRRWEGTRSGWAPETADYRRLCADLEAEILNLMRLAQAHRSGETRQ